MKNLIALLICFCISMNSSFAQNSKIKGRYKIIFKNSQIIECNLLEIKTGPIYIFQDDFGTVKEISMMLIDKWEIVKNPTPDQSFDKIDFSTLSVMQSNKKIKKDDDLDEKDISISTNQSGKNDELKRKRFSFVPNLALSKAFSHGSENWFLGFSFGADLFYHISDKISYGGRISYSFLPADVEKFFPAVHTTSSDGGLYVKEIVPSLKFLLMSDGELNISAQIGGGLFLLKTDVTVEGTQQVYYGITGRVEDVKYTFKNEETKPGLQFGLEWFLNNKYNIKPLVTLVFTEKNTTQYFSINIGYNLLK